MTTSTAAPADTRTWTVPRRDVSVPAPRREVASLLHAWDCPSDTADAALLLITELVTNAVQHADGHITCTVGRCSDVLTLSVTNTAPDGHRVSIPRPRPPRPDEAVDELAESGRGLAIVDVLADQWGSRSTADGCEVWACLNA